MGESTSKSIALDTDPEAVEMDRLKPHVNTRNILGRSSVLSKHSQRTESVLDKDKAPLTNGETDKPTSSFVKYIDHKGNRELTRNGTSYSIPDQEERKIRSKHRHGYHTSTANSKANLMTQSRHNNTITETANSV
jgi:hypothetical protein